MKPDVLETILWEIIKYETSNFTVGVNEPYKDGNDLNMFGHTDRANPKIADAIRQGTLTLEEVLAYDLKTKFRRFANPRVNVNQRVMMIIVDAHFHGSPKHYTEILQYVCNIFNGSRLKLDGVYGAKTDHAAADLSDFAVKSYLKIMDIVGPRLARAKAERYYRKHKVDVSDAFEHRQKHVSYIAANLVEVA
jgi:hypothetical protein